MDHVHVLAQLGARMRFTVLADRAQTKCDLLDRDEAIIATGFGDTKDAARDDALEKAVASKGVSTRKVPKEEQMETRLVKLENGLAKAHAAIAKLEGMLSKAPKTPKDPAPAPAEDKPKPPPT